MDNAREFMATIQKLNPSSAKGTYVKIVLLYKYNESRIN